jgi:hypothetical protein
MTDEWGEQYAMQSVPDFLPASQVGVGACEGGDTSCQQQPLPAARLS